MSKLTGSKGSDVYDSTDSPLLDLSVTRAKKLIIVGLFRIPTHMKNIHNILSDAFVDAAMDETQFRKELVRVDMRTLQICLNKKSSVSDTNSDLEEILRIEITHEQNGYILNVAILDNTLTTYTRRDCVRFINSVFNQEHFYE